MNLNVGAVTVNDHLVIKHIPVCARSGLDCLIASSLLFCLVRASVRAAAMAWSSESFRASFEMLLVLLKPQQPSTRTLIPQPEFSTTLILSSSPLIKLTSLATLD